MSAPGPPATPALRRNGEERAVSNVELFFDLVYVFAVTQLAHLLVERSTLLGAAQAAVLLAIVWQIWVYTTWAVNYLDPSHYPVRLMLLVSMGTSLVLAAYLPQAFGRHGLLIAGLFVGIQVLRSLFAIWALRGDALQLVFRRIVIWSAASGTIAIAGAFADGWARVATWALAVALDLLGGATGFVVPGLGYSRSTDWDISGSHFAERCQAFVLIALGESVVVIGALLADRETLDATRIVTMLAAFAGAVALWWVYFDRGAEGSLQLISRSADPGRLARSAFHFVHPLIIAGIIVTAAADERVLEDPGRLSTMPVAWLVLGGTGLFLGGHAIFKWVLLRSVSWPRIGAVVVLAVLLVVATSLSGMVLGVCTLAVTIGVAAADQFASPGRASAGGDEVQRAT